ncbi:dihydrolipoamide acetyltransferase family protein [Streptomyces sp. NPDC054796]
MAEVREFTLPDLGEGLTEAMIVQWLVAPGDVVAVDQHVVEVETAKALVEVPCPYAGVITARYGEEGAEIPVGTPLVTVAVGAAPSDGGHEAGADGAQGAPGDQSAPSAAGAAGAAGGPGDGRGDGAGGGGEGGGGATAPVVAGSVNGSGTGARPPGGEEASGNVLVGYGTQAPAARRRRVRGPLSTVASADTGAGAGASQGAPGRGAEPVAVISPLVRRLAREHGVDLREVSGTGPDGLIMRADVERAARALAGGAPAATAPAAAATAPTTASGAARRIPLTGLRGTVADKLSRSRHEIPDASCWVDADATELLAARRAMNASRTDEARTDAARAEEGGKVSLLALLARICTAALARFPELNATVDTKAREIVQLSEVHLGFAAQTERGLVVPVVRNAHTLGAAALSAEMSRLTEAARAGTLTPADLTGGTFTLNNYGVFGVDGSTPILNHPEAAMLGVGRIAEKPWVVNGELAVRSVTQLSFTFDHRVCDGGTAGGFLRYVADCVEQPAVLLRTL